MADERKPGKPKPSSRRTFVKAAIVGGASAAIVGTGILTQLPRPSGASTTTPPSSPAAYPQYGSYLVWFDKDAALFRRRNAATGADEFSSSDGGVVVQEAINALPAAIGGEILLTTDMVADHSIVTINKDNVSLVALRDPEPLYWHNPRPRIQKIVYTGPVRGGLLQGIHCREIQFDGSAPQEQMAMRDISMHPTGLTDQQGLRFLGGAGYQEVIEIQNLQVSLSGKGPESSAIEIANSNSGTGHITFSGNLTITVEIDAKGTPSAIKVSPGAVTGTPIRIENLSIVDNSGRTGGEGVRPIWMQSQTVSGKGLCQLNIDRFFFEQHYAPTHTIVTIDPCSAPAWFGLTIDELAISDETGKVVQLVDNKNTSWMSREQFLRVNAGYKRGVGTFTLGNVNPHQYFRLYVGIVSGMTPFGKLATPFFEGSPMAFVGAGGTSGAPTTGQYVVGTTPVIVTSTAAWSLMDSTGGLIETVPAGEARTVPLGYRVQFPSGTPSVYA